MKVETITLNEIKPAAYNPRIMSEEETEKLEKNLQEFGLVDPVIINLKNNQIIGGHQRYEILQKEQEKTGKQKEFTLIQMGDIGWVFLDEDMHIKDENHEKALNLALNKISGDWDYSKLESILDDLQKIHFKMDLTGFDDLDLTLSFDDDDIDFSMFDDDDEDSLSSVDDEEDLPPDFKEVQGTQDNLNTVIYLSFTDISHAKSLLNKLNISREIKIGGSINIVDGTDFEEQKLKYGE